MSGNFLNYIKMSRTLSRLKGDGRISLEMPQRKRASSHIEGRISWFFLSCGRKREVPLELGRGPQGPAHVASGKSSLHASCEGPLRISLQSMLGHKTSCGVENLRSNCEHSVNHQKSKRVPEKHLFLPY